MLTIRHTAYILFMMRLFGYDVICPFCFTNEKGGDADGRNRLVIIYFGSSINSILLKDTYQ